MNRRQFLASASAIGAATALPALSLRSMAAVDRDRITFGQSTPILTLDPAHGAFTGYPGGYEAALVLYDRLLDFDENMKIVPQLAESFEMHTNLMSCTIKLRSNVKFHDGTDCDADAIKFNIERMMDKTINTTNRPLWDPISSVIVQDATTIVIQTSVPFAQLPNTLAHGSGSIVSPTAIKTNGDKSIAQNPVGAGPYMLDKLRPGQELVLKAFDGYWNGKPALKNIMFKFIAEPATRINAISSGAVDVIDAVPVQLVQQLKNNSAIRIISSLGLRPIGFAINLSRKPLMDLKVRQALNYAVPLDVIVEKIFFGLAKAPDSPLAFNTIGYQSVGNLSYDPEKAKQLLEEAGYTPNNDGFLTKNGQKLTLALYTPEGLFPNDVSVTEIIAAALKKIGIDATISKIEKGAYWDELRQEQEKLKWDLAMFGFNPSNASGAYHLASLFQSNEDDKAKPDIWNIGRYNNPKIDELLTTADTAPDEKEILKALAEAQAIIWGDVPYLWLQINENVSAVRSDVNGVSVYPIVFTSLRNVTL